jgi:hypothetical protein
VKVRQRRKQRIQKPETSPATSTNSNSVQPRENAPSNDIQRRLDAAKKRAPVTEAIIQQQQEQIRQEHETAVARRHKEIVRQVDAEVAKAAQAAAQAEQAVVANRQRAIKQQQLDAEKAKQAADAKQQEIQHARDLAADRAQAEEALRWKREHPAVSEKPHKPDNDCYMPSVEVVLERGYLCDD